MIDVHSHVVFGVDDGSRSIEETIEITDAVAVLVAVFLVAF